MSEAKFTKGFSQEIAEEMYEALGYLMASLRTPAWNMAVEKAAAALAKARGEEASDE